jgi:putative endonuclease
LIALDGDVIVFVEIKTRKSQSLGQAKEAVNKRKQGQLSKSALFYMKSNNLWESKARFDVVAVRLCDGKQDIEIIKDAFELAY